jgi:hypothetical protein
MDVDRPWVLAKAAHQETDLARIAQTITYSIEDIFKICYVWEVRTVLRHYIA